MSAGLRLAFYGDDFTGATDAMESLAMAGLRTVLFLSPPEPGDLAGRFAGVECAGVAGSSRSMTTAEMDAELWPVLRSLWALGAPLLHYKVCSTFDSAPDLGSIGHVVRFAREQLTPGATVPVLAGVPALRRFTVFGHHFAAAADGVHRLDRHPTMSRHPSTPMGEADLRLHLGRQGVASAALMDLLDLDGTPADVAKRLAARLAGSPEVLLFDVLDEQRLRTAGGLLWEAASRTPQFVVGSSGLGYALTAHWRQSGQIGSAPGTPGSVAPVTPLLVLSGSASPVTARQIDWAEEHDFACLRAPAEALASPDTAAATETRLASEALARLGRGQSVVIYTAAGPDDQSLAATRARLPGGIGTARLLGGALGRLGRTLVQHAGLRRLVIAGGDTSSHAARELGLNALETLAPLSPGAPLCRGYSDDPAVDGLEIALKGGQMGGPDYFGLARGDRLALPPTETP